MSEVPKEQKINSQLPRGVFLGLQLVPGEHSAWSKIGICVSFTHHAAIFGTCYKLKLGFPGNSAVKNPPANAGDIGDVSSIPGLGRPPGEGNGNPLQYSCLENPMVREAWQATVHGVTRIGHDLATTPPPMRYIEMWARV